MPFLTQLRAIGWRQRWPLFHLTSLFVCYGIARVWFHPVPWVQLTPAIGAILLSVGTAGAVVGTSAPWSIILRPLAIAAMNLAAVYFFVDSVRGLMEVLGGWCLLTTGWPLVGVFRLRQGAAGRFTLPPSFKLPRKLQAPLTSFILPITLAWVLMSALHHQLYSSDARNAAARRNTYGPIHLKVKLSGGSAGIPEPLIVCGRAGRATMVFIRLLNPDRARLGVEFWGLELAQGEEFQLPAADGEIELTCYLPALFPEEGSSAWRNLPPEVREQRRTQYLVTVDGVVRLKGSVSYQQPPRSALYFGANPLGGSFISGKFTGTILKVSQGEITTSGPADPVSVR